MRTTRSTLAALALAVLLAAGGASGLDASDCGAEYAICLFEAGGLSTTDSIHDTTCYADYLSCIKRLLIMF